MGTREAGQVANLLACAMKNPDKLRPGGEVPQGDFVRIDLYDGDLVLGLMGRDRNRGLAYAILTAKMVDDLVSQLQTARKVMR